MRRVLGLTGLVVVLTVPAAGQVYVVPTPSSTAAATPAPPCRTSDSVRRVHLAKALFPNVRKHYRFAVGNGWPKVLVLNRRNALERSAKVLNKVKPKAGYDRDEYPPTLGRGRGKGAKQGRNPRGWIADVGYVRSPESIVAALTVAAALQPYCDGTKFRYAFT